MVTADFWIEGKADQKFLADVMKVWFGLNFNLKTFRCRDEEKKIDIGIQILGGKNAFLTDNISSALRLNIANGIQNIVLIDADKISIQQEMLENIKQELQINFPYFLLPNNDIDGELEDLLEQIIHPQNQTILECWANYEACIGQHDNPTRPGLKYTIPAKKSKIYSYLEVLLGETDSQKELAKDPNRDFTNVDHWTLDGTKEPLKPLNEFLAAHLNL